MRVEPKTSLNKASGKLPGTKDTRLKVAIVFVFIGVYYFLFKVVF